jgi:fructan beta-fructosidase
LSFTNLRPSNVPTKYCPPEPALVTRTAALPGSAEIEIELARGDWRDAGFRLTNGGGGEEVVVGVTSQPLEVFVDRRKSRATAFDGAYPGRHAGPVRWRDDTISLRVLFDRSVLEVFANAGETVITERVYPVRPFDRLELLPGGRASARLWRLQSVWPPQ